MYTYMHNNSLYLIITGQVTRIIKSCILKELSGFQTKFNPDSLSLSLLCNGCVLKPINQEESLIHTVGLYHMIGLKSTSALPDQT